MEIIHLSKPDLGTCAMECDDVIDKKLLEFPMVKDVWSKTSFNVFVGKMGSGKTSLMTQLTKKVFKRCFNHIYVFMPENSRQSIENDIFGKHLPEDQLFNELTMENLFSVYERLQENSNEKEFSLLIIDDFQAQLKDTDIVQVLQRIITKMRHLRTTVFLLQQNYMALNKGLRQIVSNIILFNVGKSQLTQIFDEAIQLEKHKYQQLIDLAFRDRHDWILINLNGSKKIYRMFDEIKCAESI